MSVLNLLNLALFYFTLCCLGVHFNFQTTGVSEICLLSRWNFKDRFILFQKE